MTPREYSEWRRTTDVYPRGDGSFASGYYALGLSGEAGEVAEKIKKMYRDRTLDEPGLLRELGDVLWYLTALASQYGWSLQDVMDANVEKLESRKARGVQHGSGDNR